jgi:ribosome-binding factor A
MPSIRLQKVADLIRDELAKSIRETVSEARKALVTVTSVTLTPDMRLARVHVSIFPETALRADIIAALTSHAGRLRRDLGRALRLRHVPDLEFRLDTSAEQAEKIERLIRDSQDQENRSSALRDEEE